MNFLVYLVYLFAFAIVMCFVDLALDTLGYEMKSGGAQMGRYCISLLVTWIICFLAVTAWEKLTATDNPADREEE